MSGRGGHGQSPGMEQPQVSGNSQIIPLGTVSHGEGWLAGEDDTE